MLGATDADYDRHSPAGPTQLTDTVRGFLLTTTSPLCGAYVITLNINGIRKMMDKHRKLRITPRELLSDHLPSAIIAIQ